jgi:hypothetical protein
VLSGYVYIADIECCTRHVSTHRFTQFYSLNPCLNLLYVFDEPQDEFYYRYIVKHNCFEPIIASFVANGNRYNLLNSAVLELIDFIRKVSCLLTSSWSSLKNDAGVIHRQPRFYG